MRKLLKKIFYITLFGTILTLVAVILLYNAFLAPKVDRYLTEKLQSTLATQLKREVAVESVHLSFPNPKIEIANLAIAREKLLSEGTLLAAKSLQARVVIRSLISDEIVIDDIILDSPSVRIEFDEQGSSNLPSFESGEAQEKQTPSWQQRLIDRLTFPHIELKDARIHFEHRQIPLRLSVEQLNTLVSLKLQGMRVQGEIDLQGGEIDYQKRGTIATALSGNFSYEKDKLSLTSVLLHAGNSELTVNGTVRNFAQPELNLNVAARLALDEIDRYAAIEQNLSGLAELQAAISGPLADISADGRLTCAEGTAWKLAFADLKSGLQYQDKRLIVNALDVDLWDGHLSGKTTLSFAGPPQYTATARLDDVQVGSINALIEDELPISGRLSGDLSVSSASWDFADLILRSSVQVNDLEAYDVNIPQMTAEVGIQEETLSIAGLQTDIFQGKLSGEATLELFSNFIYRAALELQEVELAPIMALIPEPPDVAGKVGGSLSVSGSHFDLPHLDLQADLTLDKLSAYGIQSPHLDVTARIADQLLSFDKFSAQLFDGKISGTGKLALAANRLPLFESALKLDKLSVERIMRQFAAQNSDAAVNLQGKLSGNVTSSGKSFALPDIQADVALHGAGQIDLNEHDAESVPFELDLQAALQQGLVALKNINVDSKALQLASAGSIDLNRLALDLEYQVASQNLQTLFQQALLFIPGMDNTSPLAQFRGNIERLDGSVQGPLTNLNVQANARLTNADLFWAQAQTLSAQVEYQDNMLNILEFEAAYETANVKARGSIDLRDAADPRLDLPVTAQAGNVADYLFMVKQDLPVSGKLQTIETTISGPTANLNATLSPTMIEGRAWGQRFDSLSGEIRLADNRIAIPSLKLKKNGGTVTLAGFLGFDLAFQAELDASNLNLHDLDALQAMTVQYAGKVDVALSLAGTLEDPRGNADILFKDLSYNGNPTEDVTCHIAMRNQALQAQLVTFNKKFVADLDLSLTPDLNYDATLSMERAEVERIIGMFAPIEDISGLISGTITSSGMLSNADILSASVQLSELSLDIFGQKIANDKAIDLTVTQQKLTVNSLELRGPELGLFVKGVLDFQGNYDLDLDGIIDLRPVQAFLPETTGITSLTGRVQLICNVSGTFLEPQIEGIAEIMRGRVEVAAYPDPITDINGKVALKKGAIEIIDVRGKISRGTFKSYGEITYAGFIPQELRIEVEGKELFVQNIIPDLKLKVSPHVRLTGNLSQQKLIGEVFIHEAEYTQELDFQAMVFEKTRAIALTPPETDTEIQPLAFDLFINAPKNVTLKNKLAELDLSANLRVQGTALKPQIEGRVEVLRGKVIFGDIKYTILSGVIDFLDPLKINPEMNIQTETIVKEYDIKLGIQGNLEQFNLSMTSDPPLTDGEIARLLAAGSGNGANGYNIVTKPLQTLVEGRIEKAVRLDRFSVDVDPLLSNSGDAETTPTVTLAKRLFDDLLLTFTTTVGGVDNSQIVEIEYQLSDNMSITAKRDEQGALETSFSFKFKLK